jgi:hypothetical protein
MAASTPDSGSRPITVSLPPEPAVINPGGSATIRMRLINPGTAPVSVTVSGRTLEFGDDGQFGVGSGPDPAWKDLVDFPAGLVTIPARGYVETPLTVRLPTKIDPDLYFVGFLVTPVLSGEGNLKVVNQIGWFLMVDVPGPRDRKLDATIDMRSLAIAGLDVPGFVLGSKAEGIVRVSNVGRAAVRFWGENDTTSSPGSSATHQDRIDKSLVVVGRSRSFTVTGKPNWPIGFVKMKVHLIYPGATDAATQEIVFSKRILVIHPLVLVALALLLVGAMALWLRRRRRRGRRRSLGKHARTSPSGRRHRSSNPRRSRQLA